MTPSLTERFGGSVEGGVNGSEIKMASQRASVVRSAPFSSNHWSRRTPAGQSSLSASRKRVTPIWRFDAGQAGLPASSQRGTLIKRQLRNGRGKAYLKNDLASEACTPLVASTACVTCRSTASEHNM